MQTSKWSVAALLVLGSLGATVCGTDGGGDSGRDTELTVLAASSLTEAFTEIGAEFEAANPETAVTFSFGASSELVTQITEGAPADVFASADESNVEKLTEADATGGEPRVFARNQLAIIVESGNPLEIQRVADLAREDVTVVLCDQSVPCGKYAQEVLANAGVDVTPASLEDKVKGVVSKVTLGEADAGIVYASDTNAAEGDADGVEIPAADNVIATYPIVRTAEASTPELADEFIAFVAGEAGQSILTKHGFLTP